MSTDELLMSHALRAVDKISRPAATAEPSRAAPQERASADSGTAGVGLLSPRDKLEALMLSQMNEEKAELCVGQPALQKFFEMNARFLAKVAQ